MKKRKNILSSIAILAVVAAATPLYSTTLNYSSRTAWTAAVSGITTTTFDDAISGYTPPAPNGIVNFPNTGVTLNGVLFQGYLQGNVPSSLYAVNNGPVGDPYYNWGTGGAILRGDLYEGSLARLHISLPGAVTAWGTNLMLGSSAGGSYTIQVNGNTPCPSLSCQTAPITFPNAVFFGMTSDTPFTSIDFLYTPGTYPALDNFSTAIANVAAAPETPTGETPEVATILLCATGLIGMAKSRKLRSLTLA